MTASRTPPTSRCYYRWFMRHSTRWHDNDVYGHINNTIHYQLLDTTVNNWLIERSHQDPQSSPAVNLIVESGFRYHEEMSYPSEITAGLRIAHLGTSSVRYEVGLFADAAETAAAEGFFVHVHACRATRRPMPFPPSFRAAMAHLMGAAR